MPRVSRLSPSRNPLRADTMTMNMICAFALLFSTPTAQAFASMPSCPPVPTPEPPIDGSMTCKEPLMAPANPLSSYKDAQDKVLAKCDIVRSAYESACECAPHPSGRR